MLDKLAREHAILENKVKFIQGVISGDLVIIKVKKAKLLVSLEKFGLMKWSALTAMMEKWSKFGPGLKGKAVASGDPDREQDGAELEESKDRMEEDLE